MYLYKLFLLGSKDSNLWTEWESRHNSVAVSMLCSECQPERVNDINVPMDILHLKKRLKKKKKKIIHLTDREITWTV